MTQRHKTPATIHRAATGLLFVLAVALQAAPALADHDELGVTLFRDVHFRGQYETFYDDVPELRGNYVGNDEASSIEVPSGCRVTLYRDANYRGASITLRRDVDDLGETRLGNDELTSMRVDCRDRRWGRRRDRDRYGDDRYGDREPRWRDGGYDRGRDRGVTVYEHGDFGGLVETFRYDDPDLGDNPIGPDTITSVVVSPGCRAELFQDVGFRGRSTVVFGAVKNLGYTEVGNDRVSSIRVECLNR